VISASQRGDRPAPDVIVVGDGIIGLAIATELGRRGVRCLLLGARRPGIASTAAAGILAPSVAHHLPVAARPFFYASLNRFSAFVERLREADSTLAMIDGLIEIAPEATPGESDASPVDDLDRSHLAELEPSLAPFPAARLYEREGAVDNVRVVAALAKLVGALPLVSHAYEPVAEIDCTTSPAVVRTEAGIAYSAEFVVLAAGAWSARIRGLAGRLPVRPLKGQMFALNTPTVRHAVMAPDVYLVPRNRETMVGATSEDAGFDISTTEPEIEQLHAAAVALCPALASASITRAWAGLRPVTPDMLPILGFAPDLPSLVYACGHSRNGILLAPATAEVISALVNGESPLCDIEPFRVNRFPAAGA
jgi:glycine/D-amino acid oxidase-like deaminating enzyme